MPPTLSLQGESATAVLHPGVRTTLVCVAPLSGVHFQLRRGEEVLQVPMSSTSPDRVFFHLNAVALGDGGLYTCRYQLRGQQTWSLDSAPAELLLSDGKPGGHGLNHAPEAGRATAPLSGDGEREERLGEGSPGTGGPNPPSLSFAN